MIFEYGKTRIYYETHGEAGEYLLLLHGWGGKCESWLPVIRDFSGAHRILVVDFPGHGRSSEPDTPWDVTDYMRSTLALLDALGIQKTDVMAHSFGGRVALLLASTCPERVGKMVLTGCAGLKPKQDGKLSARTRRYKRLKAWVNSPFARKLLGEERVASLQELLVQRYGSPDYRALTPSMRQTFNKVISQDLEPVLPKIQAPTLLLWGENDTATPLWMGQVMEKKIPDAGLVVLKGGDHFAYLHQYPDFKVISQRFLG